MVGTATLTGRFSVAVVTASPESKVNICEVFIVLYSATDVVSAPAVIFDNELPLITAGQRKFPKTPVIRRIASPCAEPAARFPPVQARKRAGRGKNPFLFAMLFEKNIEIFSDPNPSVLCVFSICPPPFRGWTGAGGTPGAHHDAGLPNITGFLETATTTGQERATGCFVQRVVTQGAYLSATVSQMAVYPMDITLTAQAVNAIYGRSTTVMPASVDLPVITYLGLRA